MTQNKINDILITINKRMNKNVSSYFHEIGSQIAIFLLCFNICFKLIIDFVVYGVKGGLSGGLFSSQHIEDRFRHKTQYLFTQVKSMFNNFIFVVFRIIKSSIILIISDNAYNKAINFSLLHYIISTISFIADMLSSILAFIIVIYAMLAVAVNVVVGWTLGFFVVIFGLIIAFPIALLFYLLSICRKQKI